MRALRAGDEGQELSWGGRNLQRESEGQRAQTWPVMEWGWG
jgi:hypothetical protein